MKALIYTVALLLLSGTIKAQRSDKYKIPNTSHCGMEVTCYDCTDTVARFNQKLKKYFVKEINWRVLEQITGVILIDVAVDETGHVCAKDFYNYTLNDNNTIKALNLSDLINHMAAWKPAIKNQLSVSSVRTIALYSFVKGHATFDVGYIKSNKNIKWEPSRDVTEVRKTIGTSEVDNTFDPNKSK